MERPLRLAILQRVITPYRLDLFRILAERAGIELRVFHGADIPGTKVRSKPDISGIDSIRLDTRFLKLGGRTLPWHRGLLRALEDFQPDTILAEGESHFLGYLTAIRYRRRHPDSRLVHWSLGGLPGVVEDPGSLGARIKRLTQNQADGLLVYSSFGRDALVEAGRDADSIVVGVNVSDTHRHLEAADGLELSRSEARTRIGLEDRFTVLAIGALDPNKRLDLLLDAAAEMKDEPIQFVVLGSGGILPELVERATRDGLSNVLFPGRVSEGLDLYYRAGDALLLPGRGGMVISEAMAHALPVVVHEADGTEYDLVDERVTGIRVEEGSGAAFAAALRELLSDPERTARLGLEGQRRVRQHWTLETLADRVIEAVSGAAQDVAKTEG